MNTLTTINRGAYHVEWKVLDTQERVARSSNEPAEVVYLGLNQIKLQQYNLFWGVDDF